MTSPAEHAATVREAIGADVDAPGSEQREGAALAALDALQAQAEAAEAERDRWKGMCEYERRERDRLAARVRELGAE